VRAELDGRAAVDRQNKRVLPERAEIPAFLQDLNRLAELSGLRLELIEPRPDEVGEQYVKIPVSLAFSVAYGIAFLRRAPTMTRTAVKALAVAFLAFVVLIEDGPWLLAAALALCAIGDGFLAREGEADFQRGLAAYLAGHLVYIVLFLFAGGGLGGSGGATPSDAAFCRTPGG
jgi:hypothetical protein